MGEGIDALWDAFPHINCSDIVYALMWVNALHCVWRLLRDWKVRAPCVTGTEGLPVASGTRSLAWLV
jgi:hypothetical protein